MYLTSMSYYTNLLSLDDIEFLSQLPEVLEAKSLLETCNVVYFKVPVNDSIRTVLHTLGLDVSVSEIPMRWIKGDTSPHIDSSSKAFEKTYLMYLNNSPGEFVIGNETYPITANTAIVFNEGLSHKTQNTGSVPRLLLGPMNEFAEAVGGGATITYYTNYSDAYLKNENFIATQGTTWILGDEANITGNIASYTSWRVGSTSSQVSPPTGVYSNGFNLNIAQTNLNYFVYPAAPCFLEGTKILCQVDGIDTYIPVEDLVPGTLVKTSLDGYKKVEMIGKGALKNPGNDERLENRLYKCSPSKYPELTEDIYITGCHSILVDNIIDSQREETTKHLGRIFVTSKKYRLMACIDERAEPWNSEGLYTIWHFALEGNDPKLNYGVYASGLLVETCSLWFMKTKSNMTIKN